VRFSRKTSRSFADGACIALVGSVGVPARYGGFETFVHELAPLLRSRGHQVVITCDATQYVDHPDQFEGCKLLWIPIRANGVLSTLHDTVALLRVCWKVDCILILGVSAGPVIPLVRLIGRARVVTNTDGIEWRRGKFGRIKRCLLWVFDRLAQLGSHRVVVDNEALLAFVGNDTRTRTDVIPYGGDQAVRIAALTPPAELLKVEYALTICRIEPENNLDLLIRGFLGSPGERYVIVGNWEGSEYARQLRRRYRDEPRLLLLDPIYDVAVLRGLRERCKVYLHGHSVGGTNPSLVEMLFFDMPIVAFDCPFNRQTASEAARYFSDEAELAGALRSLWTEGVADGAVRQTVRNRYTWNRIADAYERVFSTVLHG
jgi:Glycosyltransferase